LLNSWLDRLLVLLGITTLVLTIFALQYVRQGPPAPVESGPPPQASAAPKSVDPGFGFGQAGANALQAGDVVVAIRWFERAVEASPLDPDWRRLLADAYRMRGDSLRASEEGLRAFELDEQRSGASND
jgi:hypothetical protein